MTKDKFQPNLTRKIGPAQPADSWRQHFRLVSSIILLYMLLGWNILPTNAIECVECADVPSIANSSEGTDAKFLTLRDRLHYLEQCAELNPKFVHNMRCSSNDDICVKTIMFGSGGQGRDLVTRNCGSLAALQRNNAILNATQRNRKDMCYTENEMASPSPPFVFYRFCICHTDQCNEAAAIKVVRKLNLSLVLPIIAISSIYTWCS